MSSTPSASEMSVRQFIQANHQRDHGTNADLGDGFSSEGEDFHNSPTPSYSECTSGPSATEDSSLVECIIMISSFPGDNNLSVFFREICPGDNGKSAVARSFKFIYTPDLRWKFLAKKVQCVHLSSKQIPNNLAPKGTFRRSPHRVLDTGELTEDILEQYKLLVWSLNSSNSVGPDSHSVGNSFSEISEFLKGSYLGNPPIISIEEATGDVVEQMSEGPYVSEHESQNIQG